MKLIIWGLCLFSSPLFSFSNCNSFHDIYMHIIVSSHKLAVQLWGAFKIVCLCEEMVGLCVCSNECCHVPVSAAAAYNEVDFCHPSVFHQGPCISILLFSKRSCRQLKSSQGLLGFLVLVYILKNEIKPWEAIVFGPMVFRGLKWKSRQEKKLDTFINQRHSSDNSRSYMSTHTDVKNRYVCSVSLTLLSLIRGYHAVTATPSDFNTFFLFCLILLLQRFVWSWGFFC